MRAWSSYSQAAGSQPCGATGHMLLREHQHYLGPALSPLQRNKGSRRPRKARSHIPRSL